MHQADDFLEENEALFALVAPLHADVLSTETQFKRWTIEQILQHLHYFNKMALLSLQDPEAFQAEYAIFEAGRRAEGSMLGITDQRLGGMRGAELRDTWIQTARGMHVPFAAADPKARVPWAGPDMSVRSSMTARQMETWSHGQAIWDLLGQERVDTDRLRNIAHLGVATFEWTFRNRGAVVPQPMPHIRLIAQSGNVWEWGERGDNRIEGPATDFCQVVTQTRNIADVGLSVQGDTARQWMAWGQCFAGPPQDPPPPGLRYRGTVNRPA